VIDDDGKVIENILGTYTQFPLKLAYAITIHKSQ
jgi:ATP-dependent exoDNAse (exonuclease V) alpha subunit